MPQLRVFGLPGTTSEVAECFQNVREPPCDQVRDGDSERALVTADLVDDAADCALQHVRRLGLPAQDVVLVGEDTIGRPAAPGPGGCLTLFVQRWLAERRSITRKG